jgi:hypothetical protein
MSMKKTLIFIALLFASAMTADAGAPSVAASNVLATFDARGLTVKMSNVILVWPRPGTMILIR